SPSGELYRAIERFHRNVDRVRRELPAAQNQGSSMSSGSERDLRRRFTRSPQASSGALDNFRSVELPSISSSVSQHTPSLPPLRSLGSRRVLGTDLPRDQNWADLRDARYRQLMLGNYRSPPASASADSLERLDVANSHLRTLLDFTDTTPILPSPIRPDMSPPLRNLDHHDEGRRVKRRRLDSDKTAQLYRGFRYGKYGQCEPGQLTMELVSCDGGMYSNQLEYAAENILKNDTSVYCTKGNRCNIVLRHQGSTVFSLSELVIKGPGSNYSSPVREGMVFMAMDADELFNRTAQYQIQYLTGRDDGARVTRLPPVWAQSFESHHRTQLDFDGDADGDDDMESSRSQIAQLPHEFTLPPPPFTITTECSNDDVEGDAGTDGLRRSRSYGRLQIPNRIGALPFENSEDSDEGGDTWVQSNGGGGWGAFDEVTGRGGNYDRRRPAGAAAREDSVSRALQEAREASQIATQEAVRAVGGELMTPLVHFHIRENRNKCTIRFDPPVSGRFILLKMWSSQDRTNIDIQGITAKGFAGPRFVPDVEYR
ncbi:hypothetical protein CONLIGDRAFT_570249, partial [Coniochaeta ligniaria NRRL 30616]